jgi:Transposase DNA-binding
MDAATERWWDGELAGCMFADARLGRRLRKLVERMAGAIGISLPFACQDWAATKAAYRFFSNERVSEAQILAGPATSGRRATAPPPPAARSWSSTTRPSSPSGASAPRRSA